MSEEQIPRRICIDRNSPAELAIREAIRAVEAAGCDTLLTEAVILLGSAQDKVADFVDQEIEASQDYDAGTAATVVIVLNDSDGSFGCTVELLSSRSRPLGIMLNDVIYFDTGRNNDDGLPVYMDGDCPSPLPGSIRLAAQNDQPEDAQGAEG